MSEKGSEQDTPTLTQSHDSHVYLESSNQQQGQYGSEQSTGRISLSRSLTVRPPLSLSPPVCLSLSLPLSDYIHTFSDDLSLLQRYSDIDQELLLFSSLLLVKHLPEA